MGVSDWLRLGCVIIGVSDLISAVHRILFGFPSHSIPVRENYDPKDLLDLQ
jgi:hypothetical protein